MRSDPGDDLPAPPFPPTPTRVLCTRHTSCVQCGGPLGVQRKPQFIWILRPASVERGASIRLSCLDQACGAIHAPELVEIRIRGNEDWRKSIKVWAFDSEAEFVKVGRDIFASRTFAASYTALLETNHVSTSSYAKLFTQLHRPKTNWKLSTDHVWKAFVLHETLSLVERRPLTVVARSGIEEILKSALGSLLTSRNIPGALEHSCPECHRYSRTWRSGAKAAAEEGGSATFRKGADKVCSAFPSEEAHSLIIFLQELREETRIDESAPPISMAVTDGTVHGHAVRPVLPPLVSSDPPMLKSPPPQLCAVPDCPNPPGDFRSNRFCPNHDEYHGLCGVFGCGRPRQDGAEDETVNEACDDGAHQKLWEAFSKKKGRIDLAGYSRMMSGKRKRGKKEVKKEESVDGDSDESGSETDEDTDQEDDLDQKGSGDRRESFYFNYPTLLP